MGNSLVANFGFWIGVYEGKRAKLVVENFRAKKAKGAKRWFGFFVRKNARSGNGRLVTAVAGGEGVLAAVALGAVGAVELPKDVGEAAAEVGADEGDEVVEGGLDGKAVAVRRSLVEG